MKKFFRLSTLLSLAVLCLAVTLKISNIPLLDAMQLKVFDTYQQYHPRTYTEQPVRILDIDDESLAKLGKQWPWPRTLLASIIDYLNYYGAAAIGLDIVFAERDRTSPGEVLNIWDPEQGETHSALSPLLSQLPDHDAAFAESIAQANVVTGFVLTHDTSTTMPEIKTGFAVAGEPPYPHLMPFEGAVLSLPEHEANATGNGALNSSPDADGILRRVPLIYNLNNTLVPSLSAELLRIAQGARTSIVRTVGSSAEGDVGIPGQVTTIKIGHYEMPTDATGKYWIHYTEYLPERYVPVWKLFSDDFDSSLIEGHIVLIGTSAAGLKDIRSTPLNPAVAGVEVHAQALEQMLSGETLTRPDWLHGAEIMIMVCVGLLIILLMAFTNALVGAVVMITAQIAAIGGSWIAFTDYGLLIDPVYASLAILFVYLTESMARYITSEREKRQVRDAFSHYMSPDLVAQLAENPDKLKLGGETRNMTILFCDIRGFTTISEQYDAEGLTHFINEFLTPMTDIIMGNRGTIDKYMGDCIMAFWNAPLDDPDHSRHACHSALLMFQELKVLNARREKEAKEAGKPFIPVNIGVGLNSGDCCVGNMGSDQRFDYSVLGDDVNLASRLEGQSKTYGVDVVIGENTYLQARDMAAIEIDLIQVKGKTEPVRIYALLGDETLAEEEWFKQFAEHFKSLLAAYRAQDWKKALKASKACRTLAGEKPEIATTGLCDLYESRIDEYQKNPPPKDWDGVFIATSK